MKLLDSEAIEDVLRTNGLGVLSLIDGDRPYGLPMSFGYADGRVSFMLQTESAMENRKFRAIESNPTACLTVYDGRPDRNQTWRSVIVTGDLYEIPEEELGEAFFALADNAVFAPDFDVLDVPVEDIDLRYVGLTVDDISGRVYSAPDV